jgi:putative methionine-R-sulfoxide reductase with GAF domain
MTLADKHLLITQLKERLPQYAPNDNELFHDICNVIQQVSHADRVSLFSYDKDAKQLTSIVTQGHYAPIYIELGKGLVGWCALQKEIILECDVDASKHFNSHVDIGSGYQTDNALLFPLLNERNRTLGVLQLLNREHPDYTHEDEALLIPLCELLVNYL